ncbi:MULTISPECIES: radical SAM family heme chaperone HemW [Tenacibaculum]|uniref:radical SAM family heme chaperone HemW n=1 Tax=Tenacibaculum TaxID=104267 RepID=UPI001F0B3322|nr:MULTISPECIES: radical SAM family heme chaperone HemW [Tenacibaculum]MCH3880891.1 radical SAM family heme chaperone HemW [Tenacibaculum aquimarinum]MCH3884231.1 radical SAM family heme chaperone HemW [Tenacibaculum aquimarinum]MDO6599510.1 radical SAM family heme chaperone HemW [Tenacibaculum sp. 1_MG-2023]
MAGIYIHIPFCKQACNYCDFHFSISLKKKDELISCLIKEVELRKDELQNSTIETIYFGGGTPSLLSASEIELLINSVYNNFNVVENPEITLEANPDDLSEEKIIELSKSPINRLSIGVQSFFEKDLKLMNRAHNSEEAKNCLSVANQYFDNISVDLIYGIPDCTNEEWRANIKTVLSFGIPHISSYALTVEPKTVLEKLIAKGKIKNVDEEKASEQFHILIEELKNENFVHYELSNFGKEGFFSKNNSAYWLGKSYLGIGPSAHSFDGIQRSWNVRNNSIYIKSIQENKLPIEREILSKTDAYNEYIMTGLRTIWGVSLDKIKTDFGNEFVEYLKNQSEKYIKQELLYIENQILKTTLKGKFLSDGISADLFKVN